MNQHMQVATMDPSIVAYKIAQRFGLFPSNRLLKKKSEEEECTEQRPTLASQLGLQHMSDIAQALPPMSTEQARVHIANYCKVREGCEKLYALVFRLSKKQPCPESMSANERAVWLKQQAGIQPSDNGKYVVRTIEKPAVQQYPVLLVFCEDLANNLVERGLKLLQIQVSVSPDEISLANIKRNNPPM